MKIELTEDQREQIAGILATHLHNMRHECIAAHGVDQSRADFYRAKQEITERLIPLFAEEGEPEDSEEDSDEEEAING